ncbi:unnamed protein product [Brachionus calyciflorus]|uniref:RRM domain-containing protein n=1 Tax=Brachionus calyciflorus TaxID=104777 RepID=A0A814FJS1_9BILA|nr:unnamed protein product [Brachionus calyciflorus]
MFIKHDPIDVKIEPDIIILDPPSIKLDCLDKNETNVNYLHLPIQNFSPSNFQPIFDDDWDDTDEIISLNHPQSSDKNSTNILEPLPFRKVFIGGLSPKTDDKQLKLYFSKYGDLVDFIVLKCQETGRSRCFGFVTYTNSSHVDELMKNRPHVLDDRKVDVRRAVQKEEIGKIDRVNNRLFVGDLKNSISEKDLKNYFNFYGRIIDCFVIKSRGFGFVVFDDYDPVDRVLLEKYHSINGVDISCSKALPKGHENKELSVNEVIRILRDNGIRIENKKDLERRLKRGRSPDLESHSRSRDVQTRSTKRRYSRD